MSLSDNIADFATPGPNGDGSYQVTRYTSPARVNGRAQTRAVASTFPIVAQVDPTDGRDLVVLAEAQVKTESRWVQTLAAIALLDEIDIEGDGTLWAVVKCASWPDQEGGTIYRALVARQSMR